MSSAPDLMPILSGGAHNDPSEGACVMEMVSYLAGEAWSDSPACTHPVLATVARRVNDRLPDDRRHELLPLIPRLMGTASGDRSLSVGLAVWCAERVVHLAGDAEPQAREAIRVTRAWLDGGASAAECRAAYVAIDAAACAAYVAAATSADAAYAAATSARAAYADATYAATHAAAAAYAARADADADGGGDLLVGLLDEYDRLTGRAEPTPLTPDDTQRLAALTT